MSALETMKAGVSAYADGQLDKAMAVFEKARAEAESSTDPSGSHQYNILLWLARVNLDMWFIRPAEDLVETAAKIANKSLESSADGLYDLEFLPALLKCKRRLFKEADELAEKLLADRFEKNGSSSLQAAAALQEVGVILFESGRYAEAETALRKAVLIREHKLGNDNLAYAESLSTLSAVYAAQNESVRAQPLCNLALKIREKHLHANHPLVGCSLYHMAVLKLRGKRVPEAEALFRRSLKIAEDHLPANHPVICMELVGLASALLADFRYKAAQDLYERAITAAESTYPQRVSDLFAAVSGLGNAYIADNQFAKAEPLVRRALAMLREDHELQFAGERGMVENLMTTQVWQGKIVDAISLFPDQLRAKHTSDFSTLINRVESVVDFLQKNVLPQDIPDEKVNKKADE